MSTYRHCPYCNEDKPYDPNPLLRNIKVSGFYGRKCWECFLSSYRKDAPEHLHKPPVKPEYVTEDGRPYRPKVCTACQRELPHFFMESQSTKKSGFYGGKCWACYIEHMREYMREYKSYDPLYLALRARELEAEYKARQRLKQLKEEAQQRNSSPPPPPPQLTDEMYEVLNPKK